MNGATIGDVRAAVPGGTVRRTTILFLPRTFLGWVGAVCLLSLVALALATKLVAVQGNSMAPTIPNGTAIVAVWTPRCWVSVAIGDVVVANTPEGYWLKRVIDVDGSRIWLAGDNSEFSGDSRDLGWIETGFFVLRPVWSSRGSVASSKALAARTLSKRQEDERNKAVWDRMARDAIPEKPTLVVGHIFDGGIVAEGNMTPYVTNGQTLEVEGKSYKVLAVTFPFDYIGQVNGIEAPIQGTLIQLADGSTEG